MHGQFNMQEVQCKCTLEMSSDELSRVRIVDAPKRSVIVIVVRANNVTGPLLGTTICFQGPMRMRPTATSSHGKPKSCHGEDVLGLGQDSCCIGMDHMLAPLA
jgi:hypothetical protein